MNALHSTAPPKHRSSAGLDTPYPLIALLALAVAVGGGGVNAPLGNLTVQLAALAVLAVYGSASIGFFRHGPRALTVLTAATCVLPLIQIIPLPPSLWRLLPGRELVIQSLELAGGAGWFPLSVDPARTLVAFLGTLAPLTLLAVGSALVPAALVAVQRAAIGIGLASALFGTTHLFDPGWGDLYSNQRPMPGILVATFADRNAAALFFDCCLLLLVGMPARPRGTLGWLGWSLAGLFLLVCVLLTQSRTGIVLLALPVGLLAWRFAAMGNVQGVNRARRRWLIAGVGLAVAIAGAGIVSSGQVQAGFARFSEGDAMRKEMREDAHFAATRYWPVGAGMGTFDEVFQIDESLEYVSPRKAGRAHMEYLELAIEAGLAGLALAALWLAWVAWAAWKALRRPLAWPARAGALIIASIAAQSLLAFPLRNQAMLCMAALAVVLLARSPTAARPDEPR